MKIRKINIAIDGYSGTGKSSTAKEVAKRLHLTYLDTGAMYRAITYGIIRDGIDSENRDLLQDYLLQSVINFKVEGGSWNTYLNGENIEKEIRGLRVAENVSRISAIKIVRSRLVDLQQISAKKGGIVMHGRDIGTVVMPDADLKIFMTADAEVRANRRQQELLDKGIEESFEKILTNLKERDLADTSRKESPLRQAEDAVVIDTSGISFEDQVSRIVELAEQKMNKKEK